jgi:hypothetical protein
MTGVSGRPGAFPSTLGACHNATEFPQHVNASISSWSQGFLTRIPLWQVERLPLGWGALPGTLSLGVSSQLIAQGHRHAIAEDPFLPCTPLTVLAIDGDTTKCLP